MTPMHWDGRAVRPQRPPWRTDARVVVTIAPIVRHDALPEWRAAAREMRDRLPHGCARVRRIVLVAQLPDGTVVPAGLPVLDAHRRVVAHVGEHGAIALTRDPGKGPLGVVLRRGLVGVLRFTLPDAPPASRRYERVLARCVPAPRIHHDRTYATR